MSIPYWFWKLTPDEIDLGIACCMDSKLLQEEMNKGDECSPAAYFAIDPNLREAAAFSVLYDYDMVKTRLMLAP